MTIATAESTVGVLRIGPTRVAVTLRVLREVLPCPEKLEPFPAAGQGLLGAVNLRGSVVPVLDLRLLLGWSPDRNSEQIVAVLNLDGRVIGLLCDEVLGVTDLSRASLQQLADADDDLLFSHSFERPEDGRIVSLLDMERLLALPGIPATLIGDGETGAPVDVSRSGAVAELVVFRCGEIRFGLDVARVHALLPKVDLTSSPLKGRLCVGVTEYGGQAVPAVPLLRLVGLGEPSDLSGGLIIKYPEADGYVALLLSEVIEIVQVRDDELLSLPAVLSSISDWFHGLVALPGIGDVLVLDAARLHTEPELSTLAQLNTGTGDSSPVPVQRSSDEHTALAGTRYLTYAAGREAATPLLQVSEIITYPEVWTPIQREETALLGVFTHRGAVVPLVRLSALLGVWSDDAPDGEARVVIVTVPSGTVGFIVPTLRAIEESSWEEAAASGQWSFAGVTEEAAASRVIRVGTETTDRNLRTVDLAAIATALTATAAPEPSPWDEEPAGSAASDNEPEVPSAV